VSIERLRGVARYNPKRSPTKRKPTSTAKLRIDLAHLSSDLRYSNALPLRLRAACAPHALHPIDEFDAPSVRKDAQPKNTRVQPPQGAPTSHLANIEPAHLDACVCVRAYFRWRSKSGSRARVLRVCFTVYKQTNKHRDRIGCEIMWFHTSFTRVISHKIDTGNDSRDEG
jgi:hypothetical protein